MSLSTLLRDSSSPVRAFLEGISPVVASLVGPTKNARTTANSLGLVDIAKNSVLVPAPESGDNATTGTAMDIRTRIAMDAFDPRTSASAQGMSWIRKQADLVENGTHRTVILEECFDLATGLLHDAQGKEELDIAAVLFAYSEQVFRGGIQALQGKLGRSCDQALNAQDFIANIDSTMLADLRSLMNTGASQINLWQTQISNGARFEPNPDFSGSALVGGADGDWLIGDTLFDCKVYGQLSPHKLRDFLLQLLGYVMLDVDDALAIRHVGLWLPRQQLTPSWSLECLLGGDPSIVLPRLRDEFVNATKPTQIALHIPITQRRKHQLLADNWHTLPGMLDALGHSDDKDIRFRVGRNPATPERTLRVLAADRYAKVREGVALNENVPLDVLNVLMHDSSLGVRRAAESNSRSSQRSPKALDTGAEKTQSKAVEKPHSDIVKGHDYDDVESTPSIVQSRSDWSLDTDWLHEFLLTMLGGRPEHWFGRLLPDATRRWSIISGSPFQFPERLWNGLSDEVNADLLRTSRPSSIRRLIARSLPISDPEIRDQLVHDDDAEIRWEALQRSLSQIDENLTEFLNSLASSREARIKFRENKEDSPFAHSKKRELDQQVILLLAHHPATPRCHLQELLGSKRPEVLLALACNTSLNLQDLRVLSTNIMSMRTFASREFFAASQRTPIEVLKSLVSDKSPRVRELLASNVSATAGILKSLANDQDSVVRLAVFNNPETSDDIANSIAHGLLAESANQALYKILNSIASRTDVEVSKEVVQDALEKLSKSRVREPDMRCIVGGDSRASGNTLGALSKSAVDNVRCAVAGNVSAPIAVLDLLAVDLASDVRAAVAGNPMASTSALKELSLDSTTSVRVAAAKNPKLPPEALQRLEEDHDSQVSNLARRHPLSRYNSTQQKEVERSEAPSNSNKPRSVLEEMAAATLATTRIRVAYEKRTPADILKFLSGDRRSKTVRRAVAAHPNTPPEALRILASDKDLEVHQVVALNPCSPADLLAELAGRSVDFALLVSLNPGAPDEILDVLMADGEVLVQFVATVAKAQRALNVNDQRAELTAAWEKRD